MMTVSTSNTKLIRNTNKVDAFVFSRIKAQNE